MSVLLCIYVYICVRTQALTCFYHACGKACDCTLYKALILRLHFNKNSLVVIALKFAGVMLQLFFKS
jgi:hypothetical protein